MSSGCGKSCRRCGYIVCRCKLTITSESCGRCGNVPDFCGCEQKCAPPSVLPVYVSAEQSTDVLLVAATPTTLLFNTIKSLSRQFCNSQYGMWMSNPGFASGIFTIPNCASGFYSVATNVNVTSAAVGNANVTVQVMIDGVPVYSATKTLAAGASDSFHLGGGIAILQGQKVYVVVTSDVADVTVNKLGTNFSVFFAYYSKC